MIRWFVVLLAACLSTAPTRAEVSPISSRRVVGELLKRSRLLKDVQVRVPVSLWRQYVRETLAGDGAERAPVAAILEEGRYRVSVGEDRKVHLAAALTVRVFLPEEGSLLPVFSTETVWRDVKLDGEPAQLATMKGFLRFSPRQAGRFVLTASTDLGKVGADGGFLSSKKALAIPRTLITLVSFESPSAWEVSIPAFRLSANEQRNAPAGAPLSRRIVGDKTGTKGEVAVTRRERLALTIARPQPVSAKPPRFELSGPVAWDFDAGLSRVDAAVEVRIGGGRADRLELVLPSRAQRVVVTGPDVREVRGEGARAVVFLRGKVGGRTSLRVSYEMPAGAGRSRAVVPVEIAGGHWTGGTLVVTNSAGGSEVLPEAVSGLSPLALPDIGRAAATILRGPAALAYRITSRRWSAKMDVIALGEFALRETLADLAHYELAYRADGGMMCKASYEIRNRTRQFLRLDLPPGARVLLARVNERSVPVTPVEGKPGEFLLPLVRSQASVAGLVSFPLEVVYVAGGGALAPKGVCVLPLPRVDVPIAYAWADVYLPRNMHVKRFDGPLAPVAQFTSDTARASLTYGQGEYIEGYEGLTRPEGKAGGPADTIDINGPILPGVMMDLWAEREKPAPKKPTPATDLMLARNYYRAGQETYERGELSEAAGYLSKVASLAPKSQLAVNAEKLLGNIRVAAPTTAPRAQPKAPPTLAGRQERAAAAAVRKELAAGARELSNRQAQRIETGLRLAREGRQEGAQRQFEAAEAIGKELLRKGGSKAEQDARLRESRGKMEQYRGVLRESAKSLITKAEELEKQGRYQEALKAAKAARSSRWDGGQGGDGVAGLAGEDADKLKRLIVQAEKQRATRTALAASAQTDSLLVRATPEQTEELRELIEKLDRPKSRIRTEDGVTGLPKLDDVPTVGGLSLASRPAAVGKWKSYDVRQAMNRMVADEEGGWRFDEAGGKRPEDEKAKLPTSPGGLRRTGRTGAAEHIAETIREASGVQNVLVRNGNVIVWGDEPTQAAARRVWESLHQVYGPNVQMGSNIARQRAEGELKQDTERRGGRLTLGGAVITTFDSAGLESAEFGKDFSHDKSFRRFVAANYDWMAAPDKPTGWGATHKIDLSSKDSLNDETVKDVATYAGFNLGQKVTVVSVNLPVAAAEAEQVGVQWVAGRNDVRYAVVDEAQYRTLTELSAGRTAPDADDWRRQETIVGTDALLSNRMKANLSVAGDAGNRLDVRDNPIALAHQRYVLIDNGSDITAIRAGAMRHWREEGEVVTLIEAPQTIDIPRAGVRVKFEKTLIQPGDDLVIRARYTRKGEAK